MSQTIRLYKNSINAEFEWQVGPINIDDENGKEVWREDYQEHQIKGILNSPGDWYNEEKFFLTETIPTRWVIWAHSKSQGWVERIEEQVNYKK